MIDPGIITKWFLLVPLAVLGMIIVGGLFLLIAYLNMGLQNKSKYKSVIKTTNTGSFPQITSQKKNIPLPLNLPARIYVTDSTTVICPKCEELFNSGDGEICSGCSEEFCEDCAFDFESCEECENIYCEDCASDQLTDVGGYNLCQDCLEETCAICRKPILFTSPSNICEKCNEEYEKDQKEENRMNYESTLDVFGFIDDAGSYHYYDEE